MHDQQMLWEETLLGEEKEIVKQEKEEEKEEKKEEEKEEETSKEGTLWRKGYLICWATSARALPKQEQNSG